MTLNELVLQLPVPPQPGDHAIVRGPNGMNHLAIIVTARDVPENGGMVREYSFELICRIPTPVASQLEVARGESITCLLCIQWRTT